MRASLQNRHPVPVLRNENSYIQNWGWVKKNILRFASLFFLILQTNFFCKPCCEFWHCPASLLFCKSDAGLAKSNAKIYYGVNLDYYSMSIKFDLPSTFNVLRSLV